MEGECKSEEVQVHCPYCEEEIAIANFPYCKACRVTIFYCPKCKKPLPREKNVCPNCGTEIRG